jgi:hypothetical protein
MRHAALFAVVLLTACSVRCAGPGQITVPPKPIPVLVDASDVCSSACQAASSCGCPFASDESACEVACRRDQQQGSAAQLAPSCLAGAHDCGALKACSGVTGCP